MTILAAVLIALGSLIAVGNIGGCIGAYLRRRRGEGGGFSCVHFLSMLFCGLAWLLSRDQFSPWVFLPMILDPANWLLAYLPVFLLLRSRDHSRSVEQCRPAALPAEQQKRQKNVQEQNMIEKHRISKCASEFRSNRNLPEALIQYFEDRGIDTYKAILIWHDRMPFGGPTDAYRGEWLTPDHRFYTYEIYMDPKNTKVTDDEEWEDITDQVEINEHKPGTGKTSGWLCIEVLNEING